ncbi:hypothetical protein [Comamonas sp.]|uniref:hypothetical protein n=1 Tax=Comamonas sp. TaxID=34028 RepID=UPI002584791F|nr:hypothetical protein [Comamonas sp.]
MEKNKVVEFAERMQAWHQARTQQARDIQEAVKTGTTIKIQGASPSKEIEVKLIAREAQVFRMGMEAALACFDKLPFEMHRKGGAGQAQTGG